ncbi:MAG: type I-U CRISPR-associated helicase/endonuclease Cas3 [Bryobacteraceae bacterium]
MPDLEAVQFADFYEAVHGYEPFEWQKRLAKDILEHHNWRDVRVPTGCGKTSVLDIALFELALQADLAPENRTASRRICFVIDRRLVVDEVTEHAMEIRRALGEARAGRRQETVLCTVSQRLTKISADRDQVLRVVRLRGGVYRDDGWAADPLTPTVIISTVDQIGSRLLFRGYGVSPRSRSVQAGLLGFDTRIILDEAHLASVFATSLQHVRSYQTDAKRPPLGRQRGVSLVRMSATVHEKDCFELTREERKDRRLAARLNAHKCAELITVNVESISKDERKKQPRKAKEVEAKNRQHFGTSVAALAETFAYEDPGKQTGPRVIGVVVNRVSTARTVFARLSTTRGGYARDVILLTGRIRPFDRDRLLQLWLPKIRAGRNTDLNRPLFVVGTQTVEVGANLDFDALVTEAAPLDALRQRFGRLDRLGRRHERGLASPAAIVIRSDQKSSAFDDPVYGTETAETWRWLNSKEVLGKAKRIDFGVNHLDPKLSKLQPPISPGIMAPLLFPSHLDAWAQTNPEPDPDPDLEPFLHGTAGSAADVQIVWRADLIDSNELQWREIVALMPPRTRESLPVPVYEVRSWLRKQAAGEIADLEGGAFDVSAEMGAPYRRVLRWFGSDDSRTRLAGPDQVRPGDTIVVPASYGGADTFGWNPEFSEAVSDVAEPCLVQLVNSYPKTALRRPRVRLRLHPHLLPSAKELPLDRVRGFFRAAVDAVRAHDQDSWPAIERILRAIRPYVREAERAAAIDAILQAKDRPQVRLYPQQDAFVLTADVRLPLAAPEAPASENAEFEEPEDDEMSFRSDGHPITLLKHTAAVRKSCAKFARACGLEKEVRRALLLAASWHDVGKRDARFQAWLHGSEVKALVALAGDEPLAKSGRDPRNWKSSEVFGYPKGLRHEFVSVRLLEQAVGLRCSDPDLARLLVGTHHGYGRAFAPATEDRKPVEVSVRVNGNLIAVSTDHRLYRADSGWTDLFWRMVRRYGWWGLAFLEALLITSDRLVSARE